MPHGADDLAAIRLDDGRGVVLERMAEGVVGGEEEPALAAALGDGTRRAGGKRVGVEDPLHRIGRAEFSGEIRRARRMGDEQLLLLPRDLLDGEPDRRDRHVDDEVDVVGVVPLPRHRGADIGLQLMVRRDHLDRLARDLPAEIGDRHLGGGHRACAGRVRGRAREIGQDADLDDIVGDLRGGGPRAERDAKRDDESSR